MQIKDNDSSKLLMYDTKTMENFVRDFILDMRKRKLTLSTINSTCAALKHFFDINDFDLRCSKKLVKFKGNRRDNIKKNEIRGYTIDEIHKMVNSAHDQRARIMILLMCSSGIRIGAFENLRLRNLIPIDKYGIYQIIVYENTSEQYYTFCSQECRKEIDNYIEFRKRNGETIRPEHPLIREQFNTRNRIGSAKPIFLHYRSFTKMIEHVINIDAGIKKNTDNFTITTKTHSFRRFFETAVIKEGLSPLYTNILLNHDTGLEKSYFKPTVTDLLEGSDKMSGYIQVMNAVTINEENRQKKVIQDLKEDLEQKYYSLEQKNQLLTTKLQEYEEANKEGRIMSKEYSQKINELNKKFNEVIAKFEMERDEKGHLKRIKNQNKKMQE
ncbi:MAG TPA: hypothetical protein VJ697_08445, partial [Nitrososphaeraceae archaeon]|nr:hypothetical protein [Nitrososphaeraceae archaeon]